MARQTSISSLIEDRLSVVQNNKLPLKLRNSAKVVIHGIPTSLMRQFDIQEESAKDYSMMRRLYVDTDNGVHYKYASLMDTSGNSLTFGVKDDASPNKNNSSIVFTIFDEAIFEYVNSWVFRDYGSRQKYPYITYGKLMPMYEFFNLIYVQILWTLTHYQRLEINDDFLFKVTIMGSKDYSLVTDLKDPILEIDVEETHQKYALEEYQFEDMLFNYNPLSLGSQNDFERTFMQIKAEIDQGLKKFWPLKSINFDEWMETKQFNYKLSEFLKVLRSK
ncbi:MAG: hypothetical protein IH840_15135 [Candidatus Heimdallarchaeota archaeon]|nr:hypothetical protein [Candidatus Heimdallarchaeota archaeon]